MEELEVRSGLPIRIVEEALANMIRDGYMESNSTIEQVVDMAYTCCEGIAWYANGKLIQWSND
jgi:hypothetical protein